MFEIPVPLHPAIVHFPIALIFLGTLFSTLTIFTRRGALPQFAAVTLILAAGAAQVAINTGDDEADVLLKRMPEAKPLLLAHAEWGERVRNIAVFAAISAVVALAFYRATSIRRVLAFITTVLAGAACYCVFQTAENGLAMVYHHGVGVQVVPGTAAPTQPGSPQPESATSPNPSTERGAAAQPTVSETTATPAATAPPGG